jgi:hypothetical protein
MNWFLAKLVYRIFCGNGPHMPQFEEQLRLICADDELHAFHKARLFGEGDCLKNKGESAVDVKWKFIDVTELHSLTGFTDGAEICSAIREETDADLYIRRTKRNATRILQQSLHQFTDINTIFVGN